MGRVPVSALALPRFRVRSLTGWPIDGVQRGGWRAPTIYQIEDAWNAWRVVYVAPGSGARAKRSASRRARRLNAWNENELQKGGEL